MRTFKNANFCHTTVDSHTNKMKIFLFSILVLAHSIVSSTFLHEADLVKKPRCKYVLNKFCIQTNGVVKYNTQYYKIYFYVVYIKPMQVFSSKFWVELSLSFGFKLELEIFLSSSLTQNSKLKIFSSFCEFITIFRVQVSYGNLTKKTQIFLSFFEFYDFESSYALA